jgi:hypothetical protein
LSIVVCSAEMIGSGSSKIRISSFGLHPVAARGFPCQSPENPD